MILLWAILSFLSGSLMFSYWLGLTVNHNLKLVGDGNPGALNLWRTAGYWYGLAGIALDFLKGYVPVFFLLHTGREDGYGIIVSAVAAILGHMFSPFIGWRGGKAIAVTFGVWSALTGFTASLAYALILAVLLAASRWLNKGKPTSSEADGCQVVLGMLLLSIYLVVSHYSRMIMVFWLASLLLLTYTHRKELQRFFAHYSQQRQ